MTDKDGISCWYDLGGKAKKLKAKTELVCIPKGNVIMEVTILTAVC